jgi:dipeptidyl aminopeptidase/acylaminoacyl peptidase
MWLTCVDRHSPCVRLRKCKILLFIFLRKKAVLSYSAPWQTKLPSGYYGFMTQLPRFAFATAALLLGAAAPIHEFLTAAVSPDGKLVASIEGDQTDGGDVAIKHVVIRPVAGGDGLTLKLPCGEVRECAPSNLTWEPDGTHLSFILRSPGTHAHSIYTADAKTGALTRRVAFNGTLVALSVGPDGKLAALATEGAEKEVGAVEAGAAVAGVLGADVHEQRIAVLGDDGKLQFASPPDLFVYEYDWLKGGNGFVGTAAPGDGDNHWWIAKLYAFDRDGQSRVIYAPASKQMQLAQPSVSPDGKQVAFIGGLMSDFGATGGEAFVLPVEGGAAQNITPHWPASITTLAWGCDGDLLATQLHADQTQLVELPAVPLTDVPKPLFSGQVYIGEEPFDGSGTSAISFGCKSKITATIEESFTRPSEIVVGPLGQWHQLTHANDGVTTPAGKVQSVSWTSDQFDVQGWLILPRSDVPTGRKLPMITQVHGGPAWANQPLFLDGYDRKLLSAGYAVFLPNPRGSFGQGEEFTRANVKDFGYGDLRDILAGVTAAEKAAPIDDSRLGLTGWSYGGFMTMWAVTQTNRFHAAVAGAGISDWLSYYGENGIDQWMIPYFGASVYDDPAVYAKSSAINFIKNVRTPTMEVVGANDIECPAPQTQEFWHALDSLGVPTESVIYPGEGHAVREPKDIADIEKRSLAWFAKYLSGN